MRRTVLTLCALGVLSACGDPLAGVPRLAEVELSETDPAAQALPSEAEVAREGFFGTDAALAEPAAQPIAPDPAVSAPRRGGLLGLFRRAPAEVPVPTDVAVSETTDALPPLAEAEDETPVSEATVLAAAPVQEAAPRRGGLLGLFRRAAPAQTPEPVALAAPADGQGAIQQEPQLAAVAPDTEPTATPRRRGLFGGLLRGAAPDADAGSDLPEVSYGDVLPYGVMARNCSAKRQPLGRKVESATGGYELYDSNPRATGLRTFYITGFKDGCPRQLTAAHVLLGAPSFYELLHYGPAGQHLKVGATDAAYEEVKRDVCGVRKGRPCGAQMNRLERSTFFVNAYPRADDNTAWSEMLIHQGAVMATAKKSSG